MLARHSLRQIPPLVGYVEFAEEKDLSICPEKPELHSVIWDYHESRDYLSTEMRKALKDAKNVMSPDRMVRVLQWPREYMKPWL